MMKKMLRHAVLLALYGVANVVAAAPQLLAIGELSDKQDLSGLTDKLENGLDANLLGGTGSGLAYAGNQTFLALSDRGPNATEWNGDVDNTTSYISRFHTLTMNVTDKADALGLPMTVTPQLTATTLLYSASPLQYGAVVPSRNTESRFYFSGRSDNFADGLSSNTDNARFDPEGIRLGNDGTVYIADEYGPSLYAFNRASGERLRTYTLPAVLAASRLHANSKKEIANNDSGRVANKGMEGLAITPDGRTLVGFIQGPLIQDGGKDGRINRLVSIDLATGATHQYAYDNYVTETGKSYNSSELVALNNHTFLVLEQDSKGLGDGSSALVKRFYKIDLDGATDISALNNGQGVSGEASLLPYALEKTLFLDVKTALTAVGIAADDVPFKLEGAAIGSDVQFKQTTYHTLWMANDNDYLPAIAGANKFFVFGFTDADLEQLGVKGGLVQQVFDTVAR